MTLLKGFAIIVRSLLFLHKHHNEMYKIMQMVNLLDELIVFLEMLTAGLCIHGDPPKEGTCLLLAVNTKLIQ